MGTGHATRVRPDLPWRPETWGATHTSQPSVSHSMMVSCLDVLCVAPPVFMLNPPQYITCWKKRDCPPPPNQPKLLPPQNEMMVVSRPPDLSIFYWNRNWSQKIWST